MSPKSGSMRYAHIFFGWSKRLKPNESRRAFIRSAYCGEHSVANITISMSAFSPRLDFPWNASWCRVSSSLTGWLRCGHSFLHALDFDRHALLILSVANAF